MSPPNSVAKPERGSSTPPTNVVRLPLPGGVRTSSVHFASRSAVDRVVDDFASDIERILLRILGPDEEITDLLHDVLIVAMTSLHTVRDETKVRSWLTGIAVHKARRLIRHRKVRRLVRFVAPFDLPDREASTATADVSDALRETYRVLALLSTEERIAFALRQIEGMQLAQIAEVTRVSVATVKRRVSKAQQTFVALARENETLAEWLEQGTLEP